jgi:hypothetical protein
MPVIDFPSELQGDIIDNLPSDQTVPSHNEIRIVDTLFKKQKGVISKILQSSKDILLVGLLFLILSLPVIDGFIQRFFPITMTSPYFLVGIKAVIFMIIFFILNNLNLVRK